MKKDKVESLLVQVGYEKDPGEVLGKAVSFIDENAPKYKDLDIICLPEMYYKGEKDLFLDTYTGLAKKYSVNIITGSMPVYDEGEKPKNTAFVIDRSGSIVGSYSKAHMFDAYEDRESDRITPGNELGIFDLDFGKIGMIICYDVRFPEYIRTLALKGIDALFIPAAFYGARRDEWEILIRSAALSNIMYVAAVNQFTKRCGGRTSLVDPNGQITAKAPDEECVVHAVLDMDFERRMREINPYQNNRRPDLYSVK